MLDILDVQGRRRRIDEHAAYRYARHFVYDWNEDTTYCSRSARYYIDMLDRNPTVRLSPHMNEDSEYAADYHVHWSPVFDRVKSPNLPAQRSLFVMQALPKQHPLQQEDDAATPWETDVVIDPKATAFQPPSRVGNTTYVLTNYFASYGPHHHLGGTAFNAVYNKLQAPIPKLTFGNTLPHVWTMDRYTPGLRHKPKAERRRVMYGKHFIWADTLGPISLLTDELTNRFVAKMGHKSALIIHAKYAHRIDKKIEWVVYKGPVSDIKKGNRFALVYQHVAAHSNWKRSLSICKVATLIASGMSIYDGLYGPQSRAVDRLKQSLAKGKFDDFEIKDASAEQAPAQHTISPAMLAKHPELAPQAVDIELYAGVARSNTIDQHIARGKVIKNDDWKNMLLPRFMQRRPSTPARKRIAKMVAAKKQEHAALTTTVKMHQARIDAFRDDIAQAEQQIQNSTAAITTTQTLIAGVERQMAPVQEELNSFARTIEKLEATLRNDHGGTDEEIAAQVKQENTPDFFRNWVRQNWLILDVKYRHKSTGIKESIKDNPGLPLDPNWFVCSIECRTIKPCKIVVGALTDDPSQWEDIIGGPYHFLVQRNAPNGTVNVQVKLADTTGVFGTWRQNGYYWASIHPHTKAFSYSHEPMGFSKIYEQKPKICLGAAHASLTLSLYENDVNAMLVVLQSWMKNANPNDEWGAAHKHYPKYAAHTDLAASKDNVRADLTYISGHSTNKIMKKIEVDPLGMDLTVHTIPLRLISGQWVPSKKVTTKTMSADKYTELNQHLQRKGYVQASLEALNETPATVATNN